MSYLASRCRRVLGLALLLAVSGFAAAAEPGAVKTVYHVSAGLSQASNALRYIRNHLSVDPHAKIAVVAHASGIDFLLEGAKDENGNPYEALVQHLSGEGVRFYVCNITLARRKIDKSKVIWGAEIVPSGVAEIARLQTHEGYAYLRP